MLRVLDCRKSIKGNFFLFFSTTKNSTKFSEKFLKRSLLLKKTLWCSSFFIHVLRTKLRSRHFFLFRKYLGEPFWAVVANIYVCYTEYLKFHLNFHTQKQTAYFPNDVNCPSCLLHLESTRVRNKYNLVSITRNFRNKSSAPSSRLTSRRDSRDFHRLRRLSPSQRKSGAGGISKKRISI